MRHDAHYVDRLAGRPREAIGRMIPIEEIVPSPLQPRRQFDGIDDLVASIKEKGVLEPLLVRLVDDRYEIIAGERRFRAASKAGLSQVPCIEIDVDDRGCLEISLVENLQRRDLTPFEEADALQQLRSQFGFTHEQVAQKLSRSRTWVTETLTLATLPRPIREACARAGIGARSVLLQIARLEDESAMKSMLAAITSDDLRRQDVRDLAQGRPVEAPGAGDREARGSGGGGQGFTFKVAGENRPFSLTMRFPERTDVPRDELIRALEDVLRELRRQGQSIR
jgi:ParB family chromosome partitioning protein